MMFTRKLSELSSSPAAWMRRPPIVFLAVMLAAASPAATLVLRNPVGGAQFNHGGAALAELGLRADQIGSVTDAASGKPVAWQVSGGRLTVAAELGPGEARLLNVAPAPAAMPPGITVTQDVETLTIGTPLYEAVLAKREGWRFRRLTDRTAKQTFEIQRGSLTVYQDGEHDKYMKTWMAANTPFPQTRAAVAGEIVEQGPLLVRLRLAWSNEAGRVAQILTFLAGSRVIRVETRLDTAVRVVDAEFNLTLQGFARDPAEACFMPDQDRFQALYDQGHHRPAPGWHFAWNSRRKSGIGLAAAADDGIEFFDLSMCGRGEGFSGAGDVLRLGVRTPALRWQAVPGTHAFAFSLMVGGTPDEAGMALAGPDAAFDLLPGSAAPVPSVRLAAGDLPLRAGRECRIPVVMTGGQGSGFRAEIGGRVLLDDAGLQLAAETAVTVPWHPSAADAGWRELVVTAAGRRRVFKIEVAPAVRVVQVQPREIINPFNATGTTDVVVWNPGGMPETVELVSEVESGLGEIREVDRRLVTLAARERRAIGIPWATGARDSGIAFRVRALGGGAECDRNTGYTSVTDFAPKMAQVTILNAGMCHQPGSEPAWARHQREKGFGIVEYYCWAPNQVLDLTPDGENWNPHTESQGSYERTLTKTFLQTLVKAFGRWGIDAYAMTTGMAALPGMLDRPELAKYTAEGQPWVYNGKIYDDMRRYAVVCAAPYTLDFVREWGEEMARSVDMFGWKGCRWDWGFVPDIPADPLGLDANQQARFGADPERTWHDARGVPVATLYPDGDRTGAELLRAWRQAVNRRHPGFVFGGNFNCSEATQRKMPLYLRETTTRSLVLFEYLLDAARHYPTWQEWARNMTEDAQRARANGGQPCIGSMRGYAAGGVALALSQYLMFSSGCHWNGGAGMPHGRDDSWRRFQFALRFADYYYDPGFVLLPEARRDAVSVAGEGRIFWKQFVFERRRKGLRELAVHLLNLPESDFIVMHHKPPAARRNVRVMLPLEAGEKLKRVVALLPDPGPRALPLEAKAADGVVAATLPELNQTAIIVMEATP